MSLHHGRCHELKIKMIQFNTRDNVDHFSFSNTSLQLLNAVNNRDDVEVDDALADVDADG